MPVMNVRGMFVLVFQSFVPVRVLMFAGYRRIVSVIVVPIVVPVRVTVLDGFVHVTVTVTFSSMKVDPDSKERRRNSANAGHLAIPA
jgi:hypothetical protein